MMYADLECILEKMEESHMYQHHRVFSVGYYVHCTTCTTTQYLFVGFVAIKIA